MDKDIIVSRGMMDADGFLYAANCLRNGILKNGFTLGIYGPAYTANLAFACEIYLKQLLTLENKNERGHELKVLYSKLNKDHQKKIVEEYSRKCIDFANENNVEMRPLEKCIEDYNTAFEDWRYWYEGGKKSNCMGWYDFHILIEIIRDLIQKYQNAY